LVLYSSITRKQSAFWRMEDILYHVYYSGHRADRHNWLQWNSILLNITHSQIQTVSIATTRWLRPAIINTTDQMLVCPYSLCVFCNIITAIIIFKTVGISVSWCKGSGAPCPRSVVVDEDRMRPDSHFPWLASVLVVFFSASTLLVGWHVWHLTDKNLWHLCVRVLFWIRCGKRTWGKQTDPGWPDKWPLICRGGTVVTMFQLWFMSRIRSTTRRWILPSLIFMHKARRLTCWTLAQGLVCLQWWPRVLALTLSLPARSDCW